MEFDFQNQRKKNKKGMNSFNISNATKTFKKLIENNKKEEKLKNKKIYYNKTDEFFNSLNNVFFKEEIKETDIDYIFNEIKKQIKVNQHLVDLYGINAQKKLMPYSREPIRFDKKLLFNPLKNNEQKQIRYASFNNKNDKKLSLPCILKKNITIANNRDNPEKLLIFKKLESNRDINKQKKDMSKSGHIKTNSLNLNNNYNSTFNNERYIPIKTYKSFTKTNNDLLNLNHNNNNYNNNNSSFTLGNKSNFTVGNKTNSSFDRHEYLLTLDSLKDQVRHHQRKQKIYFNSNDYGCELFKSKYNYITKKFFN